MKHLITIICLLFSLSVFSQSFTIEESGVITITSEGESKFNADALNKEIESLKLKIIELQDQIEKLSGLKIDPNKVYEDVALTLYFQHSIGLVKSRTTVNDAKKEGLTTYDEIYNYSLEILKIK